MGPLASPPDATYGFVGLGNMGFGMAKNVRQKIPASSKLIVCELVKSQRDEFCSTVEGKIETAESPKEIAEKCVCMYLAGVGVAIKACGLFEKLERLLIRRAGYHHIFSSTREGGKDCVSRP